MASTLEMSGSLNTLSGVISGVRNRWRLRLALHGLTIVLGAAFIVFLGGAWVMRLFHFDPAAVIGVRVVTYVTYVGLVVRYLVFPLKRHTSDSQVALYLEERESSLDAVVLSAVETGAREMPASMRSPRFVGRVIDMAVARARAIGNGARIESRSIMQSLLSLAGILAAGALIMVFGPAYMRTSASLLAAPQTMPVQHMFIVVQPGDAKVSRHGEQVIAAQLHGFGAGQANLMTQHGTGTWERIPMSLKQDSTAFVVHLFDLKERTAYYIEAGGVRSPTYHLDIVELPYVKRMTLEYHYPAYTGLETKTVGDSGDIVAPEGTSVIARATTTLPVAGGRIAIEGHPPIPMTLGANGVLTGTIPVKESGFYKIALAVPGGSIVPGSLDYTITVIKDNDPTITFVKPGRDLNPNVGEDIVTQIQATDDYGVAAVELRYSVNGGPEQSVSLHAGGARKEVLANYTFSSKQLGLKSNDVVSYYAQATDNDGIHGGKTAKTDIYFLNMRVPDPRRRSGGGGQGQGGQGGPQGQQGQQGPEDRGEQNFDPGQFVQKQREIVVGTFKVDRDKAHIPADTRRENLTTLSLAQSQIREQVTRLHTLMWSRGIDATKNGQTTVSELLKAIAEMKPAEEMLSQQNLRGALGPEQRAFQHLKVAAAAYKQQKGQQPPIPLPVPGQGDGSAQSKSPSPPSKKKPTESDEDQDQDQDSTQKNQANQQYETNQTNQNQDAKQQQENAAAIDSLAEKLKQLAERQQQAKDQPQDSGETQNQLAKEAEQMAERAEQLAKQQPNNQALRASAQKLREAAKTMQQAAAQNNRKQFAKALEQLKAASRLLAQSKLAGESAKQQALDRARDLVRGAESLSQQGKPGQQGSPGQQGKPQQGQGKGRPGQQGQQGQQGQNGKQGEGQGQGQTPGQEGQEGQQGEGGQKSGASKKGSLHGTPQPPTGYQDLKESAMALAHDLKQQGVEAKGLQQVIGHLQALEELGTYDNSGLAQVTQELKAWEFDLRKQLEADNGSRPVLGGTEDVPADYQGLVSDYYRSLGKKP